MVSLFCTLSCYGEQGLVGVHWACIFCYPPTPPPPSLLSLSPTQKKKKREKMRNLWKKLITFQVLCITQVNTWSGEMKLSYCRHVGDGVAKWYISSIPKFTLPPSPIYSLKTLLRNNQHCISSKNFPTGLYPSW